MPPDIEDPSLASTRRAGMGSSDASVVMGVSPYLTKRKLWEIKTGRAEPEKGRWILDEGNRREVEAREAYEFQTGRIMNPYFAQANDWHFSHLDGLCIDKHTLLEAKFVGRKVFDLATRTGEYPAHFFPQVQHQLYDTAIATDAAELPVAHLALYDGEALCVITIEPDLDYQRRLYDAEHAFWFENVLADIPPDQDPEQDVDVREDDQWLRYVETYKVAKERADLAAADLELAKNQLANIACARKTVGGGLTLTRFEKRGNVNWQAKAIQERLKDLDLDTFRGKPAEVIKVTLGDEPIGNF